MPAHEALPPDWPLWLLHVLGGVYLAGFLWFFFRFDRAARRAASGEEEAVVRYNRMLRGFPNALYARMLGRRPLETRHDDAG